MRIGSFSLASIVFLKIYFSVFIADAQNLSVYKKSLIVSKTTVFSAGDYGINSYRIPSLVTTKNGTLLLFCEARRESWRDKSPTDIAFKRSTDNGKVWSEINVIASAGVNAFMDPCPVVDNQTGRIFLFVTLWPENDHSGFANTAWIMTSDDDGVSWSGPSNITAKVVGFNNHIIGFGPGSGLQMGSDQFSGRLIIPTRQMDANGKVKNLTVYSDDNGMNWQMGRQTQEGEEYQIAESPVGTLSYNRRNGADRMIATSKDGGLTWSAEKKDTFLVSVSGGCHGSVLGIKDTLFYTGPSGCLTTDTTDNRGNLTIYRSTNGGVTWQMKYLLWSKASGYSCITQLRDGRLAIAFEAADTNGFLKIRGSRPPGWMRLDVMILSQNIFLN